MKTAIVKHFGPEQRVFSGDGCIGLLAGELRRLGATRPLILCGRSIAANGTVTEMLHAALGSLAVGTFAGVTPHSDVASVERAARAVKDHHADVLIAVGGGSAIVTARAAAILAAEAGPDRGVAALATRRGPDGKLESPRLLAPKLPQIVIPTTPTTAIPKAGSAITDNEGRRRLALFDPKTRAKAIFLDPQLLGTAPESLVASAGLNALSMAIEGLATGKADPIAAAMLSAALRTCVRNLAGMAARDPQLTRLDLAWAAILCGLGTDSAGGGIASALGHAAGIVAGTTNGLVNAIVLPEVLRFNRPAIATAIPEIAHAAELAGSGDMFEGVLETIERIKHALAVPTRLRDLPLVRTLLPGIAVESMNDWALETSPRKVLSAHTMEEILNSSW